jgi:hypothetical protein
MIREATSPFLFRTHGGALTHSPTSAHPTPTWPRPRSGEPPHHSSAARRDSHARDGRQVAAATRRDYSEVHQRYGTFHPSSLPPTPTSTTAIPTTTHRTTTGSRSLALARQHRPLPPPYPQPHTVPPLGHAHSPSPVNTDLYHRHTHNHPPYHHSITLTHPRSRDRMHSPPHNHLATSTLASPTGPHSPNHNHTSKLI